MKLGAAQSHARSHAQALISRRCATHPESRVAVELKDAKVDVGSTQGAGEHEEADPDALVARAVGVCWRRPC